MFKRSGENKIAHIALAVSLLIGTFSLFSITFGLQQNSTASFYILDDASPNSSESEESAHVQDTQKSKSAFGNFFSAKTPPSLEELEEDTPEARYILQQLDRLGNIRANSFLVADLDTGEVIFERKPHTQYPIASITKYMTAYTAAENFEPNELAKITTDKLQVEGNRAHFKTGDYLTIKELMYPLLLVSSNDAGEIIAQQRNRDGFINQMKQSALDLKMFDTTFEDPTGLSKNNASTARDLFTMMRAVKKRYPQIVDISRLSFKENDQYLWTNINRASSFPEFRGGKTGYTNAARQTSIGYYEIKLANDQTKNIAVIILQSDTREQDTRNILEYLKRYVAYL